MCDLVRQANRQILAAAGGSAAVCALFNMDDADAFEIEFVNKINFLKCMAEHVAGTAADDPSALNVWHRLVACCEYSNAQQADLDQSLLAAASALAKAVLKRQSSEAAAESGGTIRAKQEACVFDQGDCNPAVAEAALAALCYWVFVFDRSENKKGKVFRHRKQQASRVLKAVRGVWMPPPADGHAVKVTSAVGGAWDSGPKHKLTAHGAPGAWIVDTGSGMVDAACTGPTCEEIQLVLLRDNMDMGCGALQPWHFEAGKEHGVVPWLLRHNKSGYLAHSHYAPCKAPQKLADTLHVSYHTIDTEADSVLSDETCHQVCDWASLKNGALVILVLQCIVETESARWWMPMSDALGKKHPDSLGLMQKLNVQLTAYGHRFQHII
jgi:hypothetical protein